MIIHFIESMPCGQFMPQTGANSKPSPCAQPATAGNVAPITQGAWELIPLCPVHLHEINAHSKHIGEPPSEREVGA